MGVSVKCIGTARDYRSAGRLDSMGCNCVYNGTGYRYLALAQRLWKERCESPGRNMCRPGFTRRKKGAPGFTSPPEFLFSTEDKHCGKEKKDWTKRTGRTGEPSNPTNR
ncbi:unnamed protein product [Calypogeia fissa]